MSSSDSDDELINREIGSKFINSLISSPDTSCALIIGKSGVGKTCLIKYFIENNTENDLFISIKIERTESEKIELVLGNIIFKLKKVMDEYSEWKVSKEKVVNAFETTLETIKFFLKIPDKLPLEKLPSIIAGIEKKEIKMGIIHEFKELINKLSEFIPDDKKLIVIIDQVERIDHDDLVYLYDILETLPSNIKIVLSSQHEIFSSEIIGKVNPKIFELESFSEDETNQLLLLNGLKFDSSFIKKFHQKYKGFPLLIRMAINEMKSTQNFDLDKLPTQLDYYFKTMISEIDPKDLSLIWLLSVFRDCISLDVLAQLLKKKHEEILAITNKKEIKKILQKNHCFELFHPLFSDFVLKDLHDVSYEQYKYYHEITTQHYLQIIETFDPGKNFHSFVSALIEAPYHAKCADLKELNLILLPALKMKILFGYDRDAIDELNWMSKKFEFLNDLRGITISNSILGEYYLNHADYRNAKIIIEHGLRVAKQSHDYRLINNFYNNLAVIFTKTNEDKKALKIYKKLLKNTSKIGDISTEFKILINISELYNEMGRPEISLINLKKAEKIEKHIDDEISIISFRNNLAKTYCELNNPEKAIENIQFALKLNATQYHLIEKGHLLNNLGYANALQGKHEDALKNYSSALKIAVDFNQPYNVGIRLLNVGVTYGKLGNKEQSKMFLKKSLNVFNQIKNKKMTEFVENELKEIS